MIEKRCCHFSSSTKGLKRLEVLTSRIELSFCSCNTTSSRFMVIFDSTPRGPLPEVKAPPRICAPAPLRGPVFWLSLDYL